MISPARAEHRRRYATYLGSWAWQLRRRRWYATHRQRHGRNPVCVVCERTWTLDDDLHHASYAHLGDERDDELVPMCRACHEALHRILDASRMWRSMPRSAATSGIIQALRSTHRA